MTEAATKDTDPQSQQAKYYWECPQCHSRYFHTPVTIGFVRPGVIGEIHPICPKCFDECPKCGEKGWYGEFHVPCGTPRLEVNLIRHRIDSDDPTFGKTTTGSTSYPTATFGPTSSGSGDYWYGTMHATQYTLAVNVTVKTLHVYNHNTGAARDFRLAVYDGGGAGAALKCQTDAFSVGALSWGSAAPSSGNKYLPAGSYRLAAQVGGGSLGGGYVYAPGYYDYYVSLSWGPFPSTYPSGGGSTSNQQICVYCTYVQIGGYIRGMKATLTENGTLNSISMYSHVAEGHLKVALYDDSGGSPNNRKCYSEEGNAPAADWIQFNWIPGIQLTAGTYHFCWQYDDDANVPSYAAGAANSGWYKQQAYGAFPNPISGVTLTTENWSIYGTYTAGTTTIRTLSQNATLKTATERTVSQNATLKATTTKTISQNAWIYVPEATEQTLSQDARIKTTSINTITQNARIKVTVAKTLSQNARIKLDGETVDPPSFGSLHFPECDVIEFTNDPIFIERVLAGCDVAFRRLIGATGLRIRLTGLVDETDRWEFDHQTHEEDYFWDTWGKKIKCLFLQPTLTEAAEHEGYLNYSVELVALEVEATEQGEGDPNSPIIFGTFGFQNVRNIERSNVTTFMEKARPGSEIAKRKQFGSSGRTVRLEGWMDTDHRAAMRYLSDDVPRQFTDGTVTFNAKMLKPNFRMEDRAEELIFYDVALLESN